jgi:hypothetical protein
MPIKFDITKVPAGYHNVKLANDMFHRRTARRQTEAQRDKIFAEMQSLIGLPNGPKNLLAARRMAERKLKELPEYWNEDVTPRFGGPGGSSSAIRQITPYAGGVFIQFQGGKGKQYWYPAGGSVATTAKRVEKLILQGSIGQYFNKTFASRNRMKTKRLKSGKIKYVGKLLDYNKIKTKF